MIRYLFRTLPALWFALFVSIFSNLLALSFLFYMRLLIDNVMPNKAMETLVLLTLLVVIALLVMGVLTAQRSTMLIRSGARFEQRTSGAIFARVLGDSTAAGAPRHTQGLADVQRIRQFLAGAGITALFDGPWVPIFLGMIFLFHPLLGLVGCAGAVLLLALVVMQELGTARARRDAGEVGQQVSRFVAAAQRHAQVVNAMGMLPALLQRWRGLDVEAEALEDRAAARSALFRDLSRAVTMGTRIFVLAVGAYLIIINEITLGTAIAAMLFMARALGPLHSLGGSWKQWQQSRLAYGRLAPLLRDIATRVEPADTVESTALVAREGRPGVKRLSSGLRTEPLELDLNGRPVLRAPALSVRPGTVLAVVGANGSGKSTLARVLLGLWQADQGRCWLDDWPLETLDREQIGWRIGYLPQNIALFDATVAENIARLGPVDSEAVVAAARAAAAHDMILQLPDGYDTRIGMRQVNLSGGQKQRVALARALYGEPDLVVLDEPDSHLDIAGEQALLQVLDGLRERNACVVVISHSPHVINRADQRLDLNSGRLLQVDQAKTLLQAVPG